MKISINIDDAIIDNLIETFVYSRDPVTRAWCSNAEWNGRTKVLTVTEYDETTDKSKKHRVTMKKLEKGLAAMAHRYAYLFEYVLKDNVDQVAADIALQCTLFGKEKYC